MMSSGDLERWSIVDRDLLVGRTRLATEPAAQRSSGGGRSRGSRMFEWT